MTMPFRALLAVLAVPLACSTPSQAANMWFMKDTPYGHFTKEDHKVFRTALREALEEGTEGQARSWSNPKTEAGGEITPLKSFERAKMKCRRAALSSKAKGRSASGEYNFCRNAEGKWGLAD
jgi:surface antigen